MTKYIWEAEESILYTLFIPYTLGLFYGQNFETTAVVSHTVLTQVAHDKLKFDNVYSSENTFKSNKRNTKFKEPLPLSWLIQINV